MSARRSLRTPLLSAVLCAAGAQALAQSGTTGLIFDGPASVLATVVEDIKAADLDGDGDAELAAFAVPYAVRTLGAVGDGTFKLLAEQPVADRPYAGVLADLNGDGRLDACVGHESGLATLLGVGDGTFAPASEMPQPKQPGVVAAGDLNGDGWSDIGHTNAYSTPPAEVHVHLSQGDGLLAPATDLVLAEATGVLLFQDLNDDGLLDLVVAEHFPQPAVLVAAGLGGGAFGPFVRHDLTLSVGHTIAVDMDVDGHLDLVMADSFGNDVVPGLWVAKGAGDGSFSSFSAYLAGGSVGSLATADLQADGLPDIAVANFNASSATVVTGTGAGALGPPLEIPIPYSAGVLLDDFTADGVPDLLAVDAQHGSLRVGLGDGTFVVPFGLPLPVEADIERVRLADMDGDGHLDAVAGDYFGQVLVARGNGHGQLDPALAWPTGADATGLAAGDVDLDGQTDVVTTGLHADTAWLLAGLPGGALGPPIPLITGAGPIDVEIADLTGDGLPDMITANLFGNSATLLQQLSSGAFHASLVPAGEDPTEVAVADLDLDGRLDAAVLNRQSNDVSILLGHPRGKLVPSGSAKQAKPKDGLCITDVDGDGVPDLVVAGDETVVILRGLGDATFGYAVTVEQGAWDDGALAVAAGDVTGDGLVDLMTSNYDSTCTLIEGREPGTDIIASRDYAVQWICSDLALGDLDEDGLDDALVGATHLTYIPWGTPDPQMLYVLLAR